MHSIDDVLLDPFTEHPMPNVLFRYPAELCPPQATSGHRIHHYSRAEISPASLQTFSDANDSISLDRTGSSGPSVTSRYPCKFRAPQPVTLHRKHHRVQAEASPGKRPISFDDSRTEFSNRCGVTLPNLPSWVPDWAVALSPRGRARGGGSTTGDLHARVAILECELAVMRDLWRALAQSIYNGFEELEELVRDLREPGT
jgi:hypothetical protein